MKAVSTEQAKTWSVSDLTARIKQLFEEDDRLTDCWVRGEISNFTHHSKGICISR